MNRRPGYTMADILAAERDRERRIRQRRRILLTRAVAWSLVVIVTIAAWAIAWSLTAYVFGVL